MLFVELDVYTTGLGNPRELVDVWLVDPDSRAPWLSGPGNIGASCLGVPVRLFAARLAEAFDVEEVTEQ